MANHYESVRGSRSKRGFSGHKVLLSRMKPFLAIGGVFTALATLYFVMGNASVPSDLSGGSVSLTAGLFDDWKTLDLTKTPLPSLTSSKEIDVKSDTVEILGVSVRYRSAEPPASVDPTGKVIFLLHGAAFTSKTWVDQVPTLQTMAALGHKALAIDLPSYGETPNYSGDKAAFLEAVLLALCGPTRPVLVSPSMSGTFSLPLLEKQQDLISGFIPVAPVSTGSYPESFYKAIHVPTLIIYGEADYGLGRESKKNLALIPTSTQPYELPKARHPAYLDQPELWHQLIHNFVTAIS